MAKIPKHTLATTYGASDLARLFKRARSTILRMRDEEKRIPAVSVNGQLRTPKRWADANKKRFHPESVGRFSVRRRMQKTPPPEGKMPLSELEEKSGGRWKAKSLRVSIGRGQWEQTTGIGKEHVSKENGIHYVSSEAGRQMLDWSGRFVVDVRKVEKDLGLARRSLNAVNYFEKKKIGNGTWTTREEADRLIREQKERERSLSTREAGRLWGGRDAGTVRRWMDAGIVRSVPDGVRRRVPKEVAVRNKKKLARGNSRYVMKLDREHSQAAAGEGPAKEDMEELKEAFFAHMNGRGRRTGSP
jgi:hypothetical protein